MRINGQAIAQTFLISPDKGENYVAELSNATLTVIMGYQADDADLTVTINRADLEQVMMGAKTLASQIEDGTAKIEGNQKVLDQLASTLVHFELGFEILPGTVEQHVEQDLNDFEVSPMVPMHE